MEEFIHSFLMDLPTIFIVFIIAFTLYTLSKGADILVDEAVSLSLHLGISKVIIGATIVSLGTTLPEASVSVMAAINGNPDLALGNAIGSIIADTGLIIGLAALIAPLEVDKMIVDRQGKIQVWAGILLAVVCLPFLSSENFGNIRGFFSSEINGNISQLTGWIFVLLLIAYIYMSIKWSRKYSIPGQTDIFNAQDNGNEKSKRNNKTLLIIRLLKLFAGVTIVIASSKILIPSVEITAIRVGIPPSIIAATLIAFGTSLPELVTAITAVKKGHGELAVGNIVGADILNVLFVVGSAAAVTNGGLDVPHSFKCLQIPAMLIILITFRLFSTGKKNIISGKEGSVLFSLYIVYIILNYYFI